LKRRSGVQPDPSKVDDTSTHPVLPNATVNVPPSMNALDAYSLRLVPASRSTTWIQTCVSLRVSSATAR
jgi:hypothetical protein